MLITIKDKSTGIIAWILVILIIISMTLFVVVDYLSDGENPPVAVVNGEEIFLSEYQNTLQQVQQNIRRQYGDGIDATLLASLGLEQQAVDSLINQRLQSSIAEDYDLTVSDKVLTEEIQQNPAFQSNGTFDNSAYRRQILSLGFSNSAQYEAEIRRDLSVNNFIQGLTNSAFITEAALEARYIKQQEIRDIDYVEILPQQFIDQITVNDALLSEYYTQHQSDYALPAKMKVRYLKLDEAAIAAAMTPDQTQLDDSYAELVASKQAAESRRASHILFQTNADQTIEQAQAKAAAALKRINAGEDFAELARELSDDAGSKIQGGDLGVITKGVMVAPFEEAVYALNENEVSAPIETDFGIHLIKLTQINIEPIPEFDDIKEDIIANAQKRYGAIEFNRLGEELKTIAFEEPYDIAISAEALELALNTSDWINAGGDGSELGRHRSVIDAMFSPQVLEDDEVSEVIEVGEEGDRQLIVLQKQEYADTTIPPFEDVKGQVEAEYRLAEATKLAVKTGEELMAKLGEKPVTEEVWQTLMSEQGLEVQSAKATQFELPQALWRVGQRLFAMPAPQENQYEVYGEVAGAGYIVTALTGVEHPESSNDANTLSEKEQLRTRFGQTIAADEYSAWFDWMRNNADVVIYEDRL